MINLKQLLFSYSQGDFCLNIPELKVDEGEKLAIIGPSGSGKTTLLNLIAGIIQPSQGTVNVNEVGVSQLSDAQRRDFRINHIGFVFQDFELLEYLNVMDNILHPYRISSSLELTHEIRDRAKTLAAQMGIDDKLGRSARDLSQGEKQRAAICRALLPGPALILADEATGNLDPRNKDHILDLLFESAESHGATLLAVTHDHELLPRFDRVIDFAEFRNETAA